MSNYYAGFFILILISSASNIVYYKLSSNFGQIFYDYSGSGNHGQNGDSTTTTTSDTIPTRRGAYFSLTSFIMLPPNSVNTISMTLGPDFSLAMWFMTQDNSDYYLSYRHKGSSEYFYVQRKDEKNCLNARIKRTDFDSNVVNYPSALFPAGKIYLDK